MSKRPQHESPDYRYGEWAGNPAGQAQRPERCVRGVYAEPGYIESQCARKRGHGYQGLYCKQHAKRYRENGEIVI